MCICRCLYLFQYYKANTRKKYHQKYLIVCQLIESSIGHTAKKFKISKKTASKIEKEFFNENGSLKSQLINQIIEMNLGVTDSHIGEELEKRRKELARN